MTCSASRHDSYGDNAGRGAAPRVSICIPAWQAAPFIARTLDCACNQTEPAVRILVSVDASSDETAAICRTYAAEDERIEVFVQQSRLGWAGNVNFLRDRVATEMFCLYFHDDLIEPQFVQRLMIALDARPDAASAHCDMRLFGGSDELKEGRAFDGPAFERVATFLTTDRRGSPLRSLTRTAMTGGLRMPARGVTGLWANEPYLIGLLAAGPSVHVRESLYRRWDRREGGLTAGWTHLDGSEIRAGMAINAAAALEAALPVARSAGERAVIHFLVFLFIVRRTLAIEKARGAPIFDDPGELHPSFSDIAPPETLVTLVPEIGAVALRQYERMLDRLQAPRDRTPMAKRGRR